jgi:creatinine amidohydrolase
VGCDRAAQHFHLPFGTDSLEARSVAVESAGLAWERGARVIVLPTVPFGVNVQQLGIPLTLNMNPSTQAALLADIADSLSAHDVPKLVVLNGHGGEPRSPRTAAWVTPGRPRPSAAPSFSGR